MSYLPYLLVARVHSFLWVASYQHNDVDYGY